MLPRGQLRKSPGKGTFPVSHCEKEANVKFGNNVCLCMFFLTPVLFVIFFPLWLAIFLLSCEFCFFPLLNIVPPGTLQIPSVLLHPGALEKEEPQLDRLRREMR